MTHLSLFRGLSLRRMLLSAVVGLPILVSAPSSRAQTACDPNVAQTMSQLGQANVNNWTTIAGNSGTGYSLLGGQGVLNAAGMTSSSSTPFGGASFMGMSCIDKMFSLMSSGSSMLFNPPSLASLENALLSKLEGMVCSKISSLMGDVTQQLNPSLFQTLSMGNTVGGFNPGMGLGSMGGGINLGGASSPVMSNSTQWYGGNPTVTPTPYSMFNGTAPTAASNTFFQNVVGGSPQAAPSVAAPTPGGLY